jgi:transposase
MPRPRLPIAAHLTPDEIENRYRSCRDGLEKTHWQVLWLLTRSQPAPSPAQVAPAVGMTAGWVRTLIKRYNGGGPESMADRRKIANGGRPKLTAEQRADLFTRLQSPPVDGGLWTGPKVAAHVAQRYRVTVAKQTGWAWLRRLGFTLQVPRPRNPKAAPPSGQREWKRRPGPSPGRASPGRSGATRGVVGRG